MPQAVPRAEQQGPVGAAAQAAPGLAGPWTTWQGRGAVVEIGALLGTPRVAPGRSLFPRVVAPLCPGARGNCLSLWPSLRADSLELPPLGASLVGLRPGQAAVRVQWRGWREEGVLLGLDSGDQLSRPFPRELYAQFLREMIIQPGIAKANLGVSREDVTFEDHVSQAWGQQLRVGALPPVLPHGNRVEGLCHTPSA